MFYSTVQTGCYKHVIKMGKLDTTEMLYSAFQTVSYSIKMSYSTLQTEADKNIILRCAISICIKMTHSSVQTKCYQISY